MSWVELGDEEKGGTVKEVPGEWLDFTLRLCSESIFICARLPIMASLLVVPIGIPVIKNWSQARQSTVEMGSKHQNAQPHNTHTPPIYVPGYMPNRPRRSRIPLARLP